MIQRGPQKGNIIQKSTWVSAKPRENSKGEKCSKNGKKSNVGTKMQKYILKQNESKMINVKKERMLINIIKICTSLGVVNLVR